MSDFYAEHESIEGLSNEVSGVSAQLGEHAADVALSSQRIARSKTLESLGYSNLTSRTQASISRLSGKVRDISNILRTVSSLYADYEGRVIAALDSSVSAGNNFSQDSRHEVRYENDVYSSQIYETQYNIVIQDGSNALVVYTNPTPEQKRQYVLSWLEQNRPELLEQIYDRLHSTTGIAAAATVAGLGATTLESATAGSTAMGVAEAAAGDGVSQQAVGEDGMMGQGGAVSEAASAPQDEAGSSVGSGGMSGGSESDWVADMLNEAVDSEAVQQAQEAVAKAAETLNPAAMSRGLSTILDSANVGFATKDPNAFSVFMAQVGDSLIAVVQKYGVQTGIFAGGAGVAYATSAISIEAVAHCAEFVTTKCMPGVQGLMAQVNYLGRAVSVNLGSTVSSLAKGLGGPVG